MHCIIIPIGVGKRPLQEVARKEHCQTDALMNGEMVFQLQIVFVSARLDVATVHRGFWIYAIVKEFTIKVIIFFQKMSFFR